MESLDRILVLENAVRELRQAVYKGGLSSAGHNQTHGNEDHIPLNNFSATAAPGVGDDSGDGYGVGSWWFDTTADKAYVCLDATVGSAVWHQLDAGGAMKTSGTGYFVVPAGPAVGTGVTSGAANAYGAAYTELLAATSAAIYIVGLTIEKVATTATYCQVKLGTGGAGAETAIGEWKISLSGSNTAAYSVMPSYTFLYPIPVATGTRIAALTADSAGTLAWRVSLICINQTDVVAL